MLEKNGESERPNRRQEDRRRTLRAGRLVFSHTSTMDCVIRNLSEDGALIRIADSVPLPARSELLLVESNTICEAEVRWQRGKEVGLHFLSKFRPSVRKFDAM